MPPLLQLADEAAYRQHFERTCCQAVVMTHDGIRVYFKKLDFDHAFFESTRRNRVKDKFSAARAERMDWIAATLANPASTRYMGWDKVRGRYDPTRCVTVVIQEFVVVLRLSKIANGGLKAQFVTCFRADWPAPGSEDTELGVLMEPEVSHGEAEVYTRVQA